MSHTRPTMQQQAAAIRQAVALLESDGRMQDPALSWLRQAETTLAAMGGMEDFIRAAYVLAKKNPVLAEVFAGFPGAEIVDVRDRKTEDDGGAYLVVEEDDGEEWRPTPAMRMDV